MRQSAVLTVADYLLSFLMESFSGLLPLSRSSSFFSSSFLPVPVLISILSPSLSILIDTFESSISFTTFSSTSSIIFWILSGHLSHALRSYRHKYLGESYQRSNDCYDQPRNEYTLGVSLPASWESPTDARTTATIPRYDRDDSNAWDGGHHEGKDSDYQGCYPYALTRISFCLFHEFVF